MCLAMPYEEIPGINSETKIYLKDLTTEIKISNNFLGRVIDFQGNIFVRKIYPLYSTNIMERINHLEFDDKNLLVCPDQFIFNLNDYNKSKQS